MTVKQLHYPHQAIVTLSPELHAVRTTLAMIGKFGITASLSIIYVYSAEVFPTVIRSVFLWPNNIQGRSRIMCRHFPETCFLCNSHFESVVC